MKTKEKAKSVHDSAWLLILTAILLLTLGADLSHEFWHDTPKPSLPTSYVDRQLRSELQDYFKECYPRPVTAWINGESDSQHTFREGSIQQVCEEHVSTLKVLLGDVVYKKEPGGSVSSLFKGGICPSGFLCSGAVANTSDVLISGGVQ